MLSFNEFNFMAEIWMVFIIFRVNNVPFAIAAFKEHIRKVFLFPFLVFLQVTNQGSDQGGGNILSAAGLGCENL